MLLDLSSKIWPVFDGEAVSPKAGQQNGNKMFRYWVPILLVMGVTVNAFGETIMFHLMKTQAPAETS